jgi:uncharacterized protein
VLLGSPGPHPAPADARASGGSPGRPAHDPGIPATLELLDWRRRVAGLYADVRREPDPRAAHAHWVETRGRLVAEHPASAVTPAARAGFGGVRVAPYDAAYRFEAELRPAVPVQWSVETGTDGTVVFERVGTADLGDLGFLDVWWLTSYGGGLFVPLKDATSGRATYGGGRYLVDTVKGADLGTVEGRLVLDLNFAYAPSCAYDAAWACPLAPEGNTLAGEVPVGELTG